MYYCINRLASCLLICLASCVFAQEASDVVTIEEKSLELVTTIRVKTQAEQSAKINNPVRWLPVKTIIPDGSKVEKGDVVTTFVGEPSEYELNRLLLQQDVIDSRLAQRIASIDNKNLDMDDQMGVLEDKLASLLSKLERQKSEPTADDIRIVEGRLRIARMNADAARKDYEKDKGRFERQMISRTELDASEKELREKEAKELFAQQELEATKNPPEREGNIRSTEIDIETTKLEIEKLAIDIKEQLQISEIQKEGAVVSKDRNERQIKEKREDIEHLTVKAPSDGFVSISRFDNNEIVAGTRMWPNYAFIEIPDMATMAFKGVLPEARRQFHAENDKVKVRLNGYKDLEFNAHIKTISTLSHDLAEKEDAGWNRERRFGVKVFDVAIVLDDKVDWVRPGMFGEADVIATKRLSGPVVPLSYVKQSDGKYFISIAGVYTEVTGIRIGAEFLLDDASLVGVSVHRGGTFEAQKDDKGETERRLSASGELLPVRSTNIVVPDIGWWPWPKITWLVPEETVVKKDDVVAKLDPKEREKQVLDEENRMTEYKSSSDELEKRVEITRRNWEFQKKVAINKLESAKISAKEALEIVSPIPVYRAEMNLKLAEIKLLDQKRKVEREESKASPTVSPAEFRRMKRDLLRSELKLEQAKLNLEKAREGKSVIAKSRAKLNLSEAEDNLEIVKRQEVYENLSIVREFERSKERLAWVERRLKFRQKQVENHTIKSPEDGLICYNKVYNNGAVTKVAVGNTVGPRFGILSIPDLSEMELKVEVDEKYYSFITTGMEVEVYLPSLSEERFKGITTGVDLLFENRAKKDSQIGLYSSHEPLGDVTFCVRVRLKQGEVPLKPGLVGQVYFPINK